MYTNGATNLTRFYPLTRFPLRRRFPGARQILLLPATGVLAGGEWRWASPCFLVYSTYYFRLKKKL